MKILCLVGISVFLTHALKRKTFEKHHQLLSFDWSRGLIERGKGILAPLQTLVKKGKTIAIPIQKFYVSTVFINENEHIARNGVFFQVVTDNSCKPVEAISHVNGTAAQKIPQVCT